MSASNRRRAAPSLSLCIGSLLMVTLAACDKNEKIDPELSRKLIEPVAKFELKRQAPAAAAGSRTGEQIYQSVCTACHAAGAAGAPKTGDKGAWEPRIAKGFETLVKNAITGIGAMPPRGGGADLTDEEVARATAYLANQAGASFTAPEASAGGSAPSGAPAASAPAEAAPSDGATAGNAPAGEAPPNADAPSGGTSGGEPPAGGAPSGR